MILRVWHGWTTPENAHASESLLHGTVIPGIRAKNVAGFLSIQVWRRRATDGETEVEFTTLMTFDSWDAVRAFAGADPERAYVPDAARKLLSRFDERSQHYDLSLGTGAPV